MSQSITVMYIYRYNKSMICVKNMTGLNASYITLFGYEYQSFFFSFTQIYGLIGLYSVTDLMK